MVHIWWTMKGQNPKLLWVDEAALFQVKPLVLLGLLTLTARSSPLRYTCVCQLHFTSMPFDQLINSWERSTPTLSILMTLWLWISCFSVQCNGPHSWQGNLDLMVFLCNNLLTLVALLFAVWLEVCLPCIRQFELWLMKGYVGINISLGSCLISRPQAYAATHLGLSWRPRLAKSGWRLDWFMLLAWFLILGNWSTQACSQH